MAAYLLRVFYALGWPWESSRSANTRKHHPRCPPPSKSTRQTGLPGNENRLFPAFNSTHPGKKIILVIDNASYHHQMNKDY